MKSENRGTRLGGLLASTAVAGLFVGIAHAQTTGDPTDPVTWRTPEFMAQYGLDYTYADQAYARGVDGSGVKIGLVDSGIDMDHPEFAGQDIQGVNWADTDWSSDVNGHGTAVAAVIIGKRDDQGMHGVAPGASLFVAPLRNKHGERDTDLIPTGITWLADQGVPFILLEWGYVELTAPEVDPDDLDPVWLDAFRHAVGTGSILIVPTHNGGRTDANLESGLPYLLPELEQGWIAVTGYNDPYANQCGVAKNWCLAAPSNYVYSAQSGGGYWSPSGTSLAGPHVAGAAALVAQMFPYMTPEQVRQVLLGTAIDIGDPGVDDVYGYGFVCAGCAVGGPGRFDWGDFHAVIESGQSVWNNDITGDGGLIKSGDGSLSLWGNSTYLGDTRIDGGVLAIGGSIASDTFVEQEGTLAGIGTVFGDVDNRGAVYAGWSRDGGTLTIDGDYRQREDSWMVVELGAPDGTSRLDVTGTAAIEGGTVDVIFDPGGYSGDARHTILTADNGVTGRFDEVCNCYAFLDFGLAYDPTNVYLDVARNGVAFADVAANRNGAAVAGGVESLGVGNLLHDIILTLSPEEASFTFSQLNGEVHPSLSGLLATQSSLIDSAVSSRLRSAFADAAAPALPVMAYGPGGLEPAPATTDRFTVWSQALGTWGRRDGTTEAAGLDHSTGGVLLGGDAAIGDFWRLGAFGGYSHTTFDSRAAAASGSAKNIHLGLYGGGEWGALALRGGAAYTWHNVETRRDRSFFGYRYEFSSAGIADYDAGTAQIFGEAGYRISAGNLRLEPFIGLAHANVRADGFTESGSNTAMSAAASTTAVTFTTLGLHAATDFDVGSLGVTARGTLGWRHAFGDTVPTSSFAFAGGSSFEIEGLPIARDTLAIEAGLDLAIAPAATLGLSYAGQIAEGARDHGFKANLAVRF
ncbi:autotransporter serine protease [Aquamicrobium sp. LC103]|uniref:autotransporter domain-containing protein n=1 Tax=Aquamicrobium sp. LC103 TaxID=1120658 RepID=UPI00148531FB|nr:autotransporter serine protease [Aquamicrobium sp. LC103]